MRGDSAVAGEGRVASIPKFHFWGECTMPLTNINSDWMSNASCKEVRTYGLENLTVIHCLSLLYSAYYARMRISFFFLNNDVMMQQR